MITTLPILRRLTLCCLLAFSGLTAFAQEVDCPTPAEVTAGDFTQPNLACNGQINVELNADCEAVIIPSQVLVGDIECLDAFAFDITVMDGNELNGNILDGGNGVGPFMYRIESAPVSGDTLTSLSIDATFVITGADGVDSDSIVAPFDFTAAALPNIPLPAGANVSASYPFDRAGIVNISVAFQTDENTDVDAFSASLDGRDLVSSLDDVTGITTISTSERVEVGSIFELNISGSDTAATVINGLEVTEFNFVENLVEPLTFTACMGQVTAKDVAVPTLVSTPDDVFGLFCIDADANNLNTLPASVSRCYMVDASGATIPGTMATELRAILDPAAFDNVDVDEALVPTFSDNCASMIEVCVSDVITEDLGEDEDGESLLDAGCGTLVITRTFRANEVDGDPANELVTSYDIVLGRPSFDDIVTESIMPSLTIDACAGANSPLQNAPGEIDFPFIEIPGVDGEPRSFSVASQLAMCARLVTTFADSPNPVETCPNTVKFQRTYTVADWCETSNVRTFTQFVKIGDNTAPIITRALAGSDDVDSLDTELVFTTNVADACAATVRLDAPGVGALDNCDGNDVELSVAIYPGGDLTRAPFGGYPLDLNNAEAEMSDALPVGEYSFVYTATDQCGNTSTRTVAASVVDGSGPVVICEDALNVSLSSPAGTATITPDLIDLGSYDDCGGDVTFQIGGSTSMDVPPATFSDDLRLTLDDLGTVIATLEVTDENENTNFCMVIITVEEKGRDACVDDVASPVVVVNNLPTECFSGCTADIALNITATDDLDADLEVGVELDANYDAAVGFVADFIPGILNETTVDADGNFNISASDVPTGDHALRLTVSDDCGNSVVTIVEISVCGDIAPTPICDRDLVAVLAPDGNGGGIKDVPAVDFIVSPPVDCLGDTVTKFAIVRFGDGPATVDMTSLTVTCADVDELVVVEVYAFDEAGNEPQACIVNLEVQEGNGVDCGGTVGNIIAGRVASAKDAAMTSVAVTLTGTADMDATKLTNAEGKFEFINLPLGGDYTLQPNYDEPVDLQSVKISDVVKISSVILGTSTFESAYDYLAADVDQSRSLNVLDMVAIQRVILGLDDMYNTNEAWGFVPATVAVQDPYATAFPSVLNANDLQANILDADFVAFSYGNVTGSGRTASTIEVAEANLAAGETHTVSIASADLVAFQGTFELASGLELVDARYTGEGGLNLAYATEGLVAAALRGDATLELDVRATEAGYLSSMLSLTNSVTVTEGVTTEGNSGSLSLAFGATNTAIATSLGNATPNPVVERTQITYTLAADANVTLSVQDIQGRTLVVRNLEGTKGSNFVNLTVGELNGATGVLTYTLTAENFSATKKLVVAAR